jgi:OPA family glycerol-3-phosphate transporter-like MFS transporter
MVDRLVVQNRPSDAGHVDFPTGDEPPPSETLAEAAPATTLEPTFREILTRVFRHPVLRWLAVAEFCTGIVRQGLLLYFPEFLSEVHGVLPKGANASLYQMASIGITVGGVAGAMVCGVVSDFFFGSRRPPVAFIFYGLQMVFLASLGLVHSPFLASLLIGVNCTWIFGVHGMLSGTASADFGGKKAAATAAGLLDGVQYLGSGFTGFGLGWLLDRYHWGIWPFCLIPFSLAGGIVMLTLWNARPGGPPLAGARPGGPPVTSG